MQREPVDLSGVVRSVNGTVPNASGNVEVATGGGAADVDITIASVNVVLEIGQRAVFDYNIPSGGGYFDIKIAADVGQQYELILVGDSGLEVDAFSHYFKLNNGSSTVNNYGISMWSTDSTTYGISHLHTGETGVQLAGHFCKYAELKITLSPYRAGYSWKSFGQGNGKIISKNAMGWSSWANGPIMLGRINIISQQAGRGYVTRLA